MTPKKRKTDSDGDRGYMEREIEIGEHDAICDRRLGWIKTAVYCIIVTVFLSGAYGWTQNEGMQSKNETQDVNIAENSKDISELKGILNEHIKDQSLTNKEILKSLSRIQTDIAVIKRNSE